MMSAAVRSTAQRGGQILVLVPTIVGLSIAAGFWLNIVYGMRIKELQYRLRNNSDQQQSVRTLSLVSRFQMLRQKAGERDSTRNYGREGRLMQALQHSVATEATAKLNSGEIAALWTIEFFNIIAKSPRFNYEQLTPQYRALESAFFLELRRNYSGAIERYGFVLADPASAMEPWYAYAKLHRAFCLALKNDRAKARTDLEDVIRANGEGEYRLTAQALLTIVSEIDHEIVKVELMAPSADKGAAYYRLTAYDKAIQTFRGLKDINSNASALYYLGRSHEENGNNAQAVEFYRKIISIHNRTDWAVKANRRLFAMGAFYTAGQEYRQESKTNVEKKIVDDQGLLKEASRFEKIAAHIERVDQQSAQVTGTAPRFAVVSVLPEVRNETKKQPVAVVPQKARPESEPRAQPEVKAMVQAETVAPPKAPAIHPEVSAPVTATGKAEPDTAPIAPPTAIELAKTWEQKEALSRKDKSAYLRQQKSLLRITLEDGNQFSGVLIRESQNEIYLFTVVGKIAIDKGQVASREKIRP